MIPAISTPKLNLDREPSIRRRNKGGYAVISQNKYSILLFIGLLLFRLPPGVVSQVQLTLRFSSQRQKLIVVVHKAT